MVIKFKDIKFGPAGLGGADEAISNLETYHKLGLKACEIAFTYGVYIKNKNDAIKIKEKANELGIKLSIHAHYFINLNSEDVRKIEASKKRILDCCRVGEELGAYLVVFHPGFYGKMDKEKSYENIRDAILDIQKEIKKNKWKINIAPETTGKVNVFGSLEEIKRLVEDTGCSFTIDFAHILAREKIVDYDKIKKIFGKYDKWHCHFSGIEYGEKGEKNHKKTTKEEWKNLLLNLPRDKEIVIINESPDCVNDSVEGLKLN
ncbi:MAG: TIM barrel protein [Candidatus Pacearchaeota archaeon]